MNDYEQELKALLEAILMASEVPLSLKEILTILDDENYSESDIIRALFALEATYREAAGGIELVEVASGWRFQVPSRFAKWVGKLFEAKQQRYSSAFFETLAIILYQQPVTRGDIEAVRGVSVSSNIIRSLEEREWIKVVGRKEVPGRPMLYGTTDQLLDDLNLKSLRDLPSLPELEELFKEATHVDEESLIV
ncbi:SMC-Scp complex subunit ScpB [Ignatzschineria sp. F8392]|uniref:SMC-Scp complex subunit ScpB n=1 Tax=Ignatzschineria sp. F8392 TaxID=1980117 RepID=UPI000B98515D|nr:SMC-Scp complex subunit ScpB [Ignatzschineria sp. F8392]OYQ77535.1 SMC-Scp complex subunit ScpB [Ignatzschineria sp. F8392]